MYTSSLARHLDRKMEAIGLSALSTQLASYLGVIVMLGTAILLSIKLQWYYFLLALASIPIGLLVTMVIGMLYQELAQFIAGTKGNEKVWRIQNFFAYTITIIFFYIAFAGLYYNVKVLI